MNFWISHDLVDLNTLNSSWHLCLFLASTNFPLHLDGFFNIWYSIHFLTKRIETSWYFDWPISFCANIYRNNDKITNILLSLGAIGPAFEEIWRFWIIMWLQDRSVTWLFGLGPLTWVRNLPIYGGHWPCECGDITFLICHVTIWSMCHATSRVRFPYPKSPHC